MLLGVVGRLGLEELVLGTAARLLVEEIETPAEVLLWEELSGRLNEEVVCKLVLDVTGWLLLEELVLGTVD